MYGDPDALRRIADRISSAADEVRADGRSAVDRARQTRWESSAAAQHRDHVEQVAVQLTGIAGGLDEAAAALRAHADVVERRIAEIRQAESAVRDFFATASKDLGSGVTSVVDSARHALHTVVNEVSGETGRLLHTYSAKDLPASGSLDWLSLSKALSL